MAVLVSSERVKKYHYSESMCGATLLFVYLHTLPQLNGSIRCVVFEAFDYDSTNWASQIPQYFVDVAE